MGEMARTRVATMVDDGAAARSALRADIQALRAFAVAAVVVYHYWPEAVPGGYIGVDVFFVVSGFLVGGALVREAMSTGRIDIVRFALRRARRILPAALVVITVTVIAMAFVASPLQNLLWGVPWDVPTTSRDALASVLQVPNLLFAVQHTEYDATDASPFLHFWSLGVEAQFYVVMPLIAVAGAWIGLRAGARSRLAMPLLLAALALASFDAALLSYGDAGLFYNPIARIWEFVFGAGLAVASSGLGARLTRHTWVILPWAVLLIVVVTVDLPRSWPGMATLVPVVAASMIIRMGTSAHGGAIARRRVVQWFGDRSYSLYLVHWPLLVLVDTGLGSETTGLMRVALFATALACAEGLYRWVEVPCRRLSLTASRDRRRTSLLVGGMSAVAALSAVLVGTHASLSPAVSARTAEAYSMATLNSKPDQIQDSVPLNVRPSLRSARVDEPASRSLGCHTELARDEFAGPCAIASSGAPLVVLFGDSHADQWYPALEALAEEGEISLLSFTASSCPVFSGLDSLAPVERCREWQQWAAGQIMTLDPALVVLSSRVPYRNSAEPYDYAEGLRTTLDRLAGLTMMWIDDTPAFPFNPARCAMDNIYELSSCRIPMGDEYSIASQDAVDAVIEGDGIPAFDPTPYLCADGQCPIILGDVLVYRDDDHLTATFAAELAPALRTAIDEALGGGPID